MKLAKYLLIGLFLVQASWLMGMESDDGVVTEFKSTSGLQGVDDGISADVDDNSFSLNYAEVLADGYLEISYQGSMIIVPNVIWNNFGILQAKITTASVFKDRFAELDLGLLFKLFKALQPTTDLKSYSISDLISLIYYANSLLIKNWELLEHILEHIKQTVTPDQLIGLNIPDIDVPFFIDLFLPLETLSNVDQIVWSPDGKNYFVIFRGHTAQLRNSAGEALSSLFADVRGINWAPDGKNYFMEFQDSTAQRYNTAGDRLSSLLYHVRDISWAPDGKSYFVVFQDGKAQRHDVTGKMLGSLLHHVSYVDWAPDGKSYFVKFIDDKAQIYNSVGAAVGSLLHHVSYVGWAPDGKSYFVMFQDGVAQRYNIAGAAIGSLFKNLGVVDWVSGKEDYFQIFSDNTAQYYNQADEAVGNLLEHVSDVSWAPDRKSYFVIFNDFTANKYSKVFDKLNFGQKLIVQAILNEFKRTDKPVILDPSLRSQLLPEVKGQLIKHGYLEYGYLAPKKLFAGALSPTMAAILKRQAKS